MPKNLPVIIAFLITVIVWSTTPLGIAWSSLSMHPSMAAFLRMLIAVIIGSIVMKIAGIPFYWNRAGFKSFAYSLVGVYFGMFASYMSALYVPSGFLSVFFAFSPITTGLLAHFFLEEKGFNKTQWLAVVIALFGLMVIFKDDIYTSHSGWYGSFLLAIGVACFSISTVLIKRANIEIHPLSQAIGSMIFSLPLFLLSWWVLDGQMPKLEFNGKSFWAIIYLGTFGSLIGFACFFYVLKRASAKTTMLVTLITPAFALWLGHWFNQEEVSITVIAGTLCIMLGLLVYRKAR